MTQRSGTYYEVQYRNGNGGLCRTPESEASVEGCRALIDEANARAIRQGFKKHQFAVFKVEWSRRFDGDALMLSTTTETYIETYPNHLL